MKSNREIRSEARGIIRTRWLGRLIFVGLSLNLIAQLAYSLLHRTFRQHEIQTWTDFLEAKVQAAQSGLAYAVPSVAAAQEMSGASAFELFITYVFGSIVIFGFLATALKATRDDHQRWFADSLGGFKRPLELAWLMLLTNLRVCLWSLLFLFPGLIAIYRYRAAWYLKVEHPDWSAWRCLAESGRLMCGYKWQALALDCSFLGWGILLGVAMLATAGLTMSGGALALLGSVLGMLLMFALVWLLVYFFTARTVFYTEVSKVSLERNEANV